MAKIVALDLGDQWVGVAISDNDHIIARPYTTITAKELMPYIPQLLAQQEVSTIVVGYPKTMRGTESAQTLKVKEQFLALEKLFPHLQWVLWDERLTSSWAAQLGKQRTKEEKLKSHARAAAFVLDSYLTYLKNMRDFSE